MSARPSHRTAPAEYDAQIAGRAAPAESSIHTLASTRLTPSVNRIVPGGRAPVGGDTGAHRDGGVSTDASTVVSLVVSVTASIEVPYSGAHASTENLT